MPKAIVPPVMKEALSTVIVIKPYPVISRKIEKYTMRHNSNLNYAWSFGLVLLLLCGLVSRNLAYECITTNQDLLEAISEYMQDPYNPSRSVCKLYGYPIGSWCVDQLQDFSNAFAVTSPPDPNQPVIPIDISDWNMQNATTTKNIFRGAYMFAIQLGDDWDLSNLEDASYMFSGAQFNLPSFYNPVSIGNWNMSNVKNTAYMFVNSDFNDAQISAWDLSSVNEASGMFSGSAMSQNLCPMGSTMNPNAAVNGMFSYSQCPVTSNPSFQTKPPGPFCQECSSTGSLRRRQK